MNYNEYRIYKDSLDLDKFNRLDCMNIYKSLELLNDKYIQNQLINLLNVENLNYDNIVDNFVNKVDFLKNKKNEIKVVEGGVVKTLETIFKNLKDELTLYIPKDVYPVYKVLANDYHTNYKEYKTFEMYDYYELEKISNSVILVTLPSKPVEFNITYKEIKELVSKDNYVLIDAVYLRKDEYNFDLISNLPNVIIIHSLSKTFLQVKKMGFVLDNTDLNIPYLLSSKKDMKFYNDVLNNCNINDILIKLIKFGWLNQDYPWKIPLNFVENPNNISSSNYFSLVKGNFYDYCDEGILTIPLSVFGIDEKYDSEYVIITPLLWLSNYLKDLKNK